jgi:hypothetical protein
VKEKNKKKERKETKIRKIETKACRQTNREKERNESKRKKNNKVDLHCGLTRCIAMRGLRYPSRLVYG